jgi:hypothetical protein
MHLSTAFKEPFNSPTEVYYKIFASYEIVHIGANSYPSFCFALLQKFIAKCVFEITGAVISV